MPLQQCTTTSDPMSMARAAVLAALAVLALLATACGPAADVVAPEGEPGTAVGSAPPAASPSARASVPAGEVLRAVEVDRRPHDDTAFTQGLEFADGRLYESRGLRARDETVILTEIDPADGTTIRQFDRVAGDDAFHEGLTVAGDRLIQLTWQQGVAHVYDVDTFERIDQLTYEGEGWGICDEPDRLLMTNGTPTLTARDPETFEVLHEVTVTSEGQPVDELNEVECVDGLVWANIWQTNRIVVIDPDTGAVVSEVDVSAFADERGRYIDGGADVLNGIAHDPLTDTWLLTGKLWPWMFEVRFECVEGCDPELTPTHYRRPTDGARPPPA